MTEQERYEVQVSTMAWQVRAWLKLHPGAEIKFQRPQDIHLPMSVATALDTSHCSANETTRQMFAELGWMRDSRAGDMPAPTPLQVEMALERAGGVE